MNKHFSSLLLILLTSSMIILFLDLYYNNLNFLIIGLIIFSLFILFLILYHYKKLSDFKNELKKSKAAFDLANLMSISFNKDGKITKVNTHAKNILGIENKISKDSINIFDIIIKDHNIKIAELFETPLNHLKDIKLELSFMHPDNKIIHTIFNVNMEFENNIKNIEIIGFDITDKVNFEGELEKSKKVLEAQNIELLRSKKEIGKLAFYDPVTQLPNRIKLMKKFNNLLKYGINEIYVLFIDLDNFKFINDSLGHIVGDALLKEVSNRLKVFCGHNMYVCRNGGDEFISLLWGINNKENLYERLNEINNTINKPYIIHDYRINITASIGVSEYPKDGIGLEEVLQNADKAMQNAKSSGKNQSYLFSTEMKEELRKKILIQKSLKKALLNNEFEVYYQPQFNNVDKKIVGFEALLRWNSPELGQVSPSLFIPIAEDCNFIIELGEWVIRRSCEFIKKISSLGFDDLTISVNLSILQLIQDNYEERILKIIDEYEISYSQIGFEVTESMLISSFDTVSAKLKSLKDKGIKIALDDFGTGYSSLSYLCNLPINTLKIDKYFIDDILKNNNVNTIIEFIIALGKKLNLTIIAEGVETEEQLNLLSKDKCDIIQGYFFSKPLNENDSIKILN